MKDRFRSPLANARGHGSAKEGVHHWWMQRLTAIMLAPLALWLVYQFLIHIIGSDREAVAAWLNAPLNALVLLVFLSAMFLHAKLGLQVVIEDYVHCPCKKMVLLIFIKIACFVLVVMSWMAIFKLHFFGIE